MKKSLRSKMTELILELIDTKKVFTTKENAQAYMKKKSKETEKGYQVPFPYSKKLEHFEFMSMNCFYLPSKTNDVILYIPGGAFVSNPHILQWNFIFEIAKKTRCGIVIPIYPKAPLHTYKETYDKLIPLYEKILETNPNKLTIMGDSAGGNIALSLALQLKNLKLKTPDNIVLYSPCLDLTMNYEDIKLYEKVDPMLGVDGLYEMYKAWAGGEDLTNSIISPIFGDFKKIGKISIFVGTHEILYPETKKFFDITLKQGVAINYFEKAGMNHVYPAHPIPEAKQAINHVAEILKN